MRYLKNFKLISCTVLLIFTISFIRSDVVSEYLDKSSINDNPSILSKVYDDNGIYIVGVIFDKSEETKYKKNSDKWYLKGHRKLTDEEIFCLENGIFSTVLADGYLDIMCNYLGNITYIN